jgi:hypothetical protein
MLELQAQLGEHQVSKNFRFAGIRAVSSVGREHQVFGLVQRERISVYRVSRSCVDCGRWGATTTVPSNTSGPRKAFISLSWARWRRI